MSRALLLDKFDALGENYTHKYVLQEILIYMNDKQLEEFYDAFTRLHPQDSAENEV